MESHENKRINQSTESLGFKTLDTSLKIVKHHCR